MQYCSQNRIMTAVDTLVLPSSFEPFGAVVGEALAWGTPVAVSERVGARGLVDEDNGAIFSLDTEPLKDALVHALKCKRGYQSLLRCDLASHVKALVNCLECN